jgi:hypothetical protein
MPVDPNKRYICMCNDCFTAFVARDGGVWSEKSFRLHNLVYRHQMVQRASSYDSKFGVKTRTGVVITYVTASDEDALVRPELEALRERARSELNAIGSRKRSWHYAAGDGGGVPSVADGDGGGGGAGPSSSCFVARPSLPSVPRHSSPTTGARRPGAVDGGGDGAGPSPSPSPPSSPPPDRTRGLSANARRAGSVEAYGDAAEPSPHCYGVGSSPPPSPRLSPQHLRARVPDVGFRGAGHGHGASGSGVGVGVGIGPAVAVAVADAAGASASVAGVVPALGATNVGARQLSARRTGPMRWPPIALPAALDNLPDFGDGSSSSSDDGDGYLEVAVNRLILGSCIDVVCLHAYCNQHNDACDGGCACAAAAVAAAVAAGAGAGAGACSMLNHATGLFGKADSTQS